MRQLCLFLPLPPDRLDCPLLRLPAGSQWRREAPLWVRCLHRIPNKGMQQRYNGSCGTAYYDACCVREAVIHAETKRETKCFPEYAAQAALEHGWDFTDFLFAACSWFTIRNDLISCPLSGVCFCGRTVAQLSPLPLSTDIPRWWTLCWRMGPMSTTSWTWGLRFSPTCLASFRPL